MSDSEVSYVSSVKRPSRKRMPYISKTRPIVLQLLILFVAVKLFLFCLVHISVATVSANNVAGDLILNLEHSHSVNALDSHVKKFLVPLLRWDAVHFFSIARNGYLFENQFAFFPLLPLLCHWLGKALSARGYLSLESGIGLAGVLISNAAHYAGALVLYALSRLLFKSSTFAFTSAVLYICNPACIQLSTFYSESLFAFLCFAGLYQFYQRRQLLAALFFGMASFTRSNGIVMTGFFVHDFLIFSFGRDGPFTGMYWVSRLFETAAYCFISVSGFVAFQVYAFMQFCFDDPARPWCYDSFLPQIYGFVQSHYWGVGLFRYFTVAQIPNFLFALPMVTICSCAAFVYFESDHRRFLTFGISCRGNRRARKLDLFLSDSVLPHIYLLLFMLFYNFFVAHVQIITRLFTFMPVVCWFMAYVMLTASERTQQNLQAFIALYGLIGSCLFALNLPPA